VPYRTERVAHGQVVEGKEAPTLNQLPAHRGRSLRYFGGTPAMLESDRPRRVVTV